MPDQPSGWGKLNQGQTYVMFAMDVARAVFAVGLGEHQASLFWHIVEHCWAPARKGRTSQGYADPAGCTIRLAELSKLWGVPLPRLSAAKKWLLDTRMIREVEGELWVNKDADTWVQPGTESPLLGPEKLAYAVAAKDRSRKWDKQESVTVDRNNCMDSVTVNRNSDAVSVTVDRKSDPTHEQPSVTVDRKLVTVDRNNCMDSVTVNRNLNGTHEQPSVTVDRKSSHCIDPAGAHARGLAKQEEQGAAAAGASEPGPEEQPPAYPDPDRSPLIIMTGPCEVPDQEGRSIFRLIWDTWREERLCNEFFEHQRFHKPESWRAAIRELKRRGQKPRAIRLVEILASEADVGRLKQKEFIGAAPAEPAPKREPYRAPDWYDHPAKRGTKTS